MPSKLRDFGNRKIIILKWIFFSLMLELAQFKCCFEFKLQRQVFKNHKSSSISYKMVSIFTFTPAIKALNLIMFHTTCSLIRVYYNAWKRDTLFEVNNLLTFNDSVQLFQCWGRVLSYPPHRGGGGGGLSSHI